MKYKILNCGCSLFYDENDNLIGWQPHGIGFDFDYILTTKENEDKFENSITIPKWSLISLAPSEFKE